MQCPKCKTEINKKLTKCPKCGTRIASICKDCGMLNPINATECSRCHKVLLKICSECGSANLPEAKSCRKCGIEFVNKNLIKKPEYSAEMNSQQKVRTLFLEAIKNGITSVIALCGESGSGKNLVVRYVMNDLKSANIIWLIGTCTQVTQLSPFGYFQDVLLNFFNINNFCPDTLQLKRNSVKFFRQDFPILSNSEILDLLNFLYPENVDKFENIYLNKTKMFTIMKKVILTIIQKVKTVFVIDNFENIDGMSFDFLQEILKDEYILERCKFVILSRVIKPAAGMISSPLLTSENYTDLTIAPFTAIQVQTLISQYRDFNAGADFAKVAAKVANGNPAIVEQMIMLYQDTKRNGLKHITYDSPDAVINARLGILRNEDYSAYRMLSAMTILGSKFYPAMLEHIDNNTSQEFERIIDVLVERGYITQLNNLSFEFKSFKLWSTIVSIIKNEDFFEEILNILYETIGYYKQSSIALLGYIVQKLNNNDRSFEIWTQLMKQSAYIGDIGLYIIAQKQALKLIEHKTSPYYLNIKKNINTRVGKLLVPINHELAFEYLQKAITLLNDNEEYAYIDLLGYIASCAMKSGNYWGVIECADNVLNKLSQDMELERALVKSRQVRPLVRLGNYGQAVNLVDTEIMPIFEKYLSRGKNTPIITMDKLYSLWLELYFDFAEALTFQGDSRMFDIIKLLFDIIEKNKMSDISTSCKVHLALALANTIKGDFKTSEKILDDILKEFSLDNMNSFIVSRWNFIDILNKFFAKNYDSLYIELFNVVTYANNVNDTFTKNILKTLLAKVLFDKGNSKKALDILEDQVAYFAKEKISTGVLLSWYLISSIKLVTKGSHLALDIATKALDIALSPNINNYYFVALFNKLIGEIHISRQDFESAKVHIEKSLFVAKQFNLQEIMVKDYLLFAKLYQEMALPKTTSRAEYIRQALKMFQAAKSTEIVLEHLHLQKLIKDELSVLTSFCKLNGIVLKKSSK